MQDIQLSTDNAANKLALSDLRKAIRGHYGKVAELAGVHYITVVQVLNGKWINKDILSAAAKVRAELEQQKAA